MMVALFASCFIIASCDSNLSTIEGSELRKRAYHCVMEVKMTTADLQICQNIQRECLRRQQAGQFDC
jgi:predicted ATPase with chaperone activity